ncbi:MAG: hypothetical protein WBP45_10260 [Daejeonella sp.]
MNNSKKNDIVLSKFSYAFKVNFHVLEDKGFNIKGCGFGGRLDDDYIGFYLINKLIGTELNVLFWINLFEYNEDEISITYSYFKRVNKNGIKDIFRNRISFKDLEGITLNDKIKSLINRINEEYSIAPNWRKEG